jgi:hypothetical protein
MRSVTLSSVFEFVPVSFEEITNCLRFITLRTCAQSTAKQQKSSKTKSPTFGVSKSFTWKGVGDSICLLFPDGESSIRSKMEEKVKKGFSIVSLTLLCTSLTVSY